LQHEQLDKNPYHYCANSPIDRIDPAGMSDGDFYSLEGKWLLNDGIDDKKVYVQDENGSKTQIPLINTFSEVPITNDELNLRASLSTLKQAEAGRFNLPLDYNSWNNGAVFTNDSYSENPDAYSAHPGKNPTGGTAAGAYQFLERFYTPYNLPDFSPISQDQAAVKNMTTASYNAALSGNMSSFKSTTSSRWTSLNHWSISQLQKVFQQYRANELQGKSDIATPIGILLRK
jgi:muramidase (phage lysozyme)